VGELCGAGRARRYHDVCWYAVVVRSTRLFFFVLVWSPPLLSFFFFWEYLLSFIFLLFFTLDMDPASVACPGLGLGGAPSQYVGVVEGGWVAWVWYHGSMGWVGWEGIGWRVGHERESHDVYD
jgi:hypothetical protein